MSNWDEVSSWPSHYDPTDERHHTPADPFCLRCVHRPHCISFHACRALVRTQIYNEFLGNGYIGDRHLQWDYFVWSEFLLIRYIIPLAYNLAYNSAYFRNPPLQLLMPI